MPRRLGDVMAAGGAWGPEGKLYFSRDRDLYIAEHDGSSPKKLATMPGTITYLSFSPDNQRMSLTIGNELNATFANWEANVDGSDARPLYPEWGGLPQECCGNWTPDSRYFVFESQRGGGDDIYVRDERLPFWKKQPKTPMKLTAGPLYFGIPLPGKDGKKLFVVGVQARGELVRYDAKSGEFVP